MANEKKCLVVLGAGASHDIAEIPLIPLEPRDARPCRYTIPSEHPWRPPLTADLFSFDARPHYYELLDPYRMGTPLAEQLARDMKANKKGSAHLEDRLRALADHRSHDTQRAFKFLPPYIRDLIGLCNRFYVRHPTNYATLLRALIDESGHQLGFVVMNYDCFLEDALSYYGRSFNELRDYLPSGDYGPLVKLHGSIRWFKRIGRSQAKSTMLREWCEQVAQLDLDSLQAIETEIKRMDDTPTWEIGEHRTNYYPVVTAPLAGKASDHRVCPDPHIDKLVEWSQDCDKALVIGVSGHDENLFALLQRCFPQNERALRGRPHSLVHVVGTPNDMEVRNSFASRVWSMNGEKVEFFRNLFIGYLRSGLFKELCDW